MNDSGSMRILGAVRFIDAATGVRIARPLEVETGDLRLYRNRSGDYAIVGVNNADLAKHVAAFATAPAIPAPQALRFTLSVKDPGREFLATAFTIQLPRQSEPGRAGDADSIFRAVEVPLLSTPGRSVEPNWCVVRVSVGTAAGAPVRDVGVKVARSDAAQLYFAITGADGEALAPVPGLPFLFAGGANADVISDKIDGTIQIFVHGDGLAVTPDMLRANDNKLVEKGNVPVALAAGKSIYQKFTVNP